MFKKFVCMCISLCTLLTGCAVSNNSGVVQTGMPKETVISELPLETPELEYEYVYYPEDMVGTGYQDTVNERITAAHEIFGEYGFEGHKDDKCLFAVKIDFPGFYPLNEETYTFDEYGGKTLKQLLQAPIFEEFNNAYSDYLSKFERVENEFPKGAIEELEQYNAVDPESFGKFHEDFFNGEYGDYICYFFTKWYVDAGGEKANEYYDAARTYCTAKQLFLDRYRALFNEQQEKEIERMKTELGVMEMRISGWSLVGYMSEKQIRSLTALEGTDYEYRIFFIKESERYERIYYPEDMVGTGYQDTVNERITAAAEIFGEYGFEGHKGDIYLFAVKIDFPGFYPLNEETYTFDEYGGKTLQELLNAPIFEEFNNAFVDYVKTFNPAGAEFPEKAKKELEQYDAVDPESFGKFHDEFFYSDYGDYVRYFFTKWCGEVGEEKANEYYEAARTYCDAKQLFLDEYKKLFIEQKEKEAERFEKEFGVPKMKIARAGWYLVGFMSEKQIRSLTALEGTDYEYRIFFLKESEYNKLTSDL